MTEKQEDLLFWAAATGQQDLLETCLSQKKAFDLNRRGPQGRTAIMEAALQGKKRSFEMLVMAGADLSKIDDEGQSCLMLAVQGGNSTIVKDLLMPQRKRDVDHRDQNGQTALMVSAVKGDLVIFKMLLSAGADITLTDSEGDSCLHIASKHNHVSIVKHILKKELLPTDAQGYNEQTAMMVAVFEGRKEVFEILLSHGADITVVDAHNNDILMLAVFSRDISMVEEVLKTKIFDVNRKGDQGMTVIMMAALFGEKDIFDLLVSEGAHIDMQNEFGNDMLFWAASGGNGEIVKGLLSKELFDINRKQEHGLTSLHIAITKGNVEVFEILSQEGADVNLCNDQQYNSLMIATQTGSNEIVKKLLSLDSLDIDKREENGWTALMIAAKSGHVDIFDLHLAKGADAMLVDKESNNCLLLASIYNQPLMVAHLLALDKYDINTRGIYSWTAIMAASNEGHEEVFDNLLMAGGEVTLLDERGNNSLILACMGGSVHIVKRLLAMKVFDLEYSGKDGSVVTVAGQENDTTILELLVQAGAKLHGITEN